MQASDRIRRQACAGIAQLNAEPELPGPALEHLPVSEYHDARGELLPREGQTEIGADARRLPRGHRYDRNGIRARRNACPRRRRFFEPSVHRSSIRISM